MSGGRSEGGGGVQILLSFKWHMAKGRFYFYSLFLPLLPSPLPRKLRQQERHKTNHTKFVNVPCGWGMGEVSLRLRLRSRFINLPSIISANPATRPCHVPPGQTALSQCSLHKRNPPRPCTAGESADGCFNDRARAGRARGGPGVPIPNPKGLLRRQFLASIFVCSTPPPHRAHRLAAMANFIRVLPVM